MAKGSLPTYNNYTNSFRAIFMSLPFLLADSTQLAIGWGITAGGIIISIALICFPWKRKSPLPEEHK